MAEDIEIRGVVNRYSAGCEQDALPHWVVFRAGAYAARLPIQDTPVDLWRYVLDITVMGFRADRVGDEIVITGRPSNSFGGLVS